MRWDVPVVHGVGGLADTVVDYGPATPKPSEGGPAARKQSLRPPTGFVLRDYTPAALLEALNRALTVFADPAEWRTLQTSGMQQDFSWDRSAQEYVKMYERALAGAGG
jgi:starch synthase